MAMYQKEAFDITQDFQPVWKIFMALKPEKVKKAEHIRLAIEEYVKNHNQKNQGKGKE